MIAPIREQFNQQFTKEKYEYFLKLIRDYYNHDPLFRKAETPFFIPTILKDRLLEACEEIVETLLEKDLKERTQGSLFDVKNIVPNEDEYSTFLQMDFGVTLDENGDPMPMLIEVQGFPSVYFFQRMVTEAYKKAYDLPEHLTSYFNGYNPDSFKELLKEVIVGDTPVHQVIILEVEPTLQNTYIDLLATSIELGIPVKCVTDLFLEGKKLYYLDAMGSKVEVIKIYNRVIFDELYQRQDLEMRFNFYDDIDVEWIGHPNWFFRISKYLIPFLKSKYVPETYFLDKVDINALDLSQYVLKPLFSFAGSGVIIDVTSEDLAKIKDTENYILQRKVQYEPVIESPDEPVKVEIRMMMIWPKNTERPIVVNNLVRLSKGKMIGVKYNKDKDWVGGSVGFYEGDV